MSKYLCVKYLLISIQTSALSQAVQKIDFLGPILGGNCPKKFREKKLHFQLNNFTQKLDFDVLWFRRSRAYKFYEEKKGKIQGKNPHRGQTGLVGMKGHLKTYYHVKYFFAVLKPFLTETAFYAKLAGRFSGSKTKIT